MIKSLKLAPVAIALAFLVGCTKANTKLVDGQSAGSIYVGGLVNQKVTGDADRVSVWNVWTAEDGLSLAAQHCQNFGKTGAEIVSQRGITAYYRCQEISAEIKEKIFASAAVRAALTDITTCIRTNVMVLDDYVSDASTIAQAVAQQCRESMAHFVEAYVSELPNSNQLSEAYLTRVKSQFSETEQNRVLPYVLGWRSLVKNGWDKRRAPTQKEAPDDLFYQSI
jgi:hypothetical protein